MLKLRELQTKCKRVILNNIRKIVGTQAIIENLEELRRTIHYAQRGHVFDQTYELYNAFRLESGENLPFDKDTFDALLLISAGFCGSGYTSSASKRGLFREK